MGNFGTQKKSESFGIPSPKVDCPGLGVFVCLVYFFVFRLKEPMTKNI